MKKYFLPLIVVLIILLGIFIARFVVNGGEDSWICVNGQWEKHGQPNSPPPETDCPKR